MYACMYAFIYFLFNFIIIVFIFIFQNQFNVQIWGSETYLIHIENSCAS